jgi:glycerophosphoryl diester phosphodiesterase
MKSGLLPLALAAAVVAHPTSYQHEQYLVSVGPRPYYIINNMTDGPLKQKLQSCENKSVKITDFSIGHRGGGTLQFPEETKQSEDAGARMGSGILECDVSFTGDRGLVCRHSLCDLHTTTDILTRPALAKKCTVPFTPANGTAPANALCCTSDITTAECMCSSFKHDLKDRPLTSIPQHRQQPMRQARRLQRFRRHSPSLPSWHAELAHRTLRHLRQSPHTEPVH